MDTGTINWSDYQPKNGISCFFTEENFERYSKTPSLEERIIETLQEFQKNVNKGSHKDRQKNKDDIKEEESATDGESGGNKEKVGNSAGKRVIEDSDKKINIKQDSQQKDEGYWKRNSDHSNRFNDVRLCRAVIPPPRKSLLTQQEHYQYIHLYPKYANMRRAPKETEIAEYDNFQECRKIITEEQKEFMLYLEKLAKANKSDYSYMTPGGSKYVEEWLNCKRKEVEYYKKFYNNLDKIPLHVPPTQMSPQLIYNQTLLELGHVPKMIVPDLSTGNRPVVPTEYQAVVKNYPVAQPKTASGWSHQPCSLDTNAETLAIGCKAHVVLSSGSLQCLVDNHAPSYSREWELPVVIKEQEYMEGDKKVIHKTIYIDRPFISNKIDMREKHSKFLKNAFKTYALRLGQVGHIFTVPKKTSQNISKSTNLLHSKNPPNKPQSDNTTESNVKTDKLLSPPQLPMATETSDDNLFDVSLTEDIEDLETFGTSSKKSKCTLSENKTSETAAKNDILDMGVVMESPDKTSGQSNPLVYWNSEKSINVKNSKKSTTDKNSKKCSPEKSSEKSLTNKSNEKSVSNENSELKSIASEVLDKVDIRNDLDVCSKPESSDISDKAKESDNDMAIVETEENIVEKLNRMSKRGTLTEDIETCSPEKIRRTSSEIPTRSRLDSSSSCDSESERLMIEYDSQEDTTKLSKQDKERMIKSLSMETEEYIDEPPASPDMENPVDEDFLGGPASPDAPASPDMCASSDIKIEVSCELSQSKAEFFSPGGRKCVLIPLQRDNAGEENVMDHSESLLQDSDGEENVMDQLPSEPLFPTPPLIPKVKKYTRRTRSSSKSESVMETEGDDEFVKPNSDGIDQLKASKSKSDKIDDSDTDKDDGLVLDIPDLEPDEIAVPARRTRYSFRTRNQSKNEKLSTQNVESDSLKKKGKFGFKETLALLEKVTEKRRSRYSDSDVSVRKGVKMEVSETNISEKDMTENDNTRSKGRYRTRSAGSVDKLGQCETNIKEENVNDLTPEFQNNDVPLESASLPIESNEEMTKTIRNPMPVTRRSKRNMSMPTTPDEGKDTSLEVTPKPLEMIPPDQSKEIPVKRGRGRPRKSRCSIEQPLTLVQNESLLLRKQISASSIADEATKIDDSNQGPATSPVSTKSLRGRQLKISPGKTDSVSNNDTEKTKTPIKSGSETSDVDVTAKQNKNLDSTTNNSSLNNSGTTNNNSLNNSGTTNNSSINNAGSDSNSDKNSSNTSNSSANNTRSSNTDRIGQTSESAGNVEGKSTTQTTDVSALLPVNPSVAAGKNKTSEQGNKDKKQNLKRKSSSDGKKQNSSTLDTILQLQEQMLHTEGHKVTSKGSKSAAEVSNIIPDDHIHTYKCPEKNNITYHLWTLGGFRVIVRCGYHGIYKNRRQQMCYAHVIPKLEYQTLYGREVLTASEISRSYFSTYIRPNTKLVRARINPLKSELVVVEELGLKQIIPKNTEPVYNPMVGFEMMHNVFQRLYQLPAGQYLLQHTEGSPDCQIKKATENNKRGAYDLHFQYLGFMSTTSTTSQSLPWLPIDTNIILSLHKKQNRVPATFEPKDFRAKKKKKRKSNNQKQKQK